jgi:hypothetical protein
VPKGSFEWHLPQFLAVLRINFPQSTHFFDDFAIANLYSILIYIFDEQV